MKLTVTFDLNEIQLGHLQEAAKLEPGWHYCDLIIRHNGENTQYQAEFMRDFFREIRKVSQ